MTTAKPSDKPKVPFYYSNEQGMGVPSRCRCIALGGPPEGDQGPG
jgi:hypothetical protein